jgi:hypothetical protein
MTAVQRFLSLILLLLGSSFAFSQNYMDVSGANIDFTNIVEAGGLGLFGQPGVLPEDILNFPVDGFNAEAQDGAMDFVFGSIQLDASSNSGLPFSSVSLSEFGVYFNTGTSMSSVAAFLTVVTSDGIFTDNFGFDFNGGNGFWQGQATVTFPQTFNAQIFFNNILLADSNVGEVASINKRKASIRVGVVPEPSISIIGLAMVGMLAGRRRR